MANREALRQLQSRLAQRLQLARSEPAAAGWLAVECAGQGLLVPLPSAGEIFSLTPLTPMPHTRAWFAGVANLRGQLHGVVDLAAFLGLRPQALQFGPDARRDSARLLALNPTLGANCAVLVDRLAGLRALAQLHPEPEPDPGHAADSASPRPAFAGGVFRDEAGRRWQAIDLAALARDEHFLGIAA